ncbi:MAG: sigma-54-dependent Fis family transcriptional regulator [Planctomycetaceae bacterium]|nr:sigma-54-dependent Fis family transcriptional regulator [Planctomycetaceae bacterium]
MSLAAEELRSLTLLNDLGQLAVDAPSLDAFTATALGKLAPQVGADFATLVTSGQGQWRPIVEHGRPQPLPLPMLAETLDREQTVAQGNWLAAPLVERAMTGELLVIHTTAAADRQKELVTATALVLGRLLELRRRMARNETDRVRLRAVLDAAARWNRIHEMEPLLEQMARVATEMLRCDRATIFLWHRPQKELVGRPALGVENGELRIADDVGLVGNVVRTGVAGRVDLDRDQKRIDHRVDKSLGYQTRTLLCVPMRSASGEVIGAFEAINKLEGSFSDEDEATLSELAAQAAIALANTQDRQQLVESRRQISDQAAERVHFVGQCPAIEALRSTIRRVAQTDLAVLVLGENGTGKDVVAQSVHYQSSRRDQPLISVNCAALPETLIESELFGHEKGAFTDARDSRTGKFELAHGGTLFLDEIGDLSLGGQAKLLRVVEEKIIVRVGGSKPISVDVRLVAATNQDLGELVRQKKFRQDLFYRLNVVSLTLPPLRDRGTDITVLAEHFLRDFSIKARRTPPKFSAAAARRLETHTWPGNVRELRNLMERIAYLVAGDRIEVEDLAFILAPGADPTSVVPSDLHLSAATDLFQADYIQQAVKRAGGNMSRVADLLGLHRSNLYRKMKQLGMHVE